MLVYQIRNEINIIFVFFVSVTDIPILLKLCMKIVFIVVHLSVKVIQKIVLL